MAGDLQAEALQRLDTFSDWLPKLLYTAIVVYLGWSIIKVYQTAYAPVFELLKE